jgi:hypothetical protein
MLSSHEVTGGLCNVAFGAENTGSLIKSDGTSTTSINVFGESWRVPPPDLFVGVDEPSLYSKSTTAT